MSQPNVQRPLGPGDRLPEIIRQGPDGRALSLYEYLCGDPSLVAVSAAVDQDAESLIAFDRLVSAQTDYNGAAIVAGSLEDLQAFVTKHEIKTPFVVDDGNAVKGCLGGDRDARVRFFAVDPTVRISGATSDPAEVASIAPKPEDHARSWQVLNSTAPVLVVPNVLEPEVIEAAIAAYEGANEESGMVRFVDGQMEMTPDSTRKVRRDHTVTDQELLNSLTDRIARRVLPEVGKAFYYPVTRFEQFKVVCYKANEAEEQSAYFRLHRDNVTPDSRHRRFAMTLNLNTGDYEGGYLRFPEFGPELYNPPAGSAIVFSGAHLHEATDVTKGRRLALLTFFFGEDAVQQREK